MISTNTAASVSESCSYCGSSGGEYHWCRPRSGKPLVVKPKLLADTKTQTRHISMTPLGIAVFLGCVPLVAQAASDPAAFPWSLVAPGTSAGAIIVVVWLMLKKLEKSDSVFSEAIVKSNTSFADTIAKTQASFTTGLADISRSTQDSLREIRDSIRDLSAHINDKKE